MSAPVRVAVAGLGWAGREIWLSRLVAHPAYEVVAAVDTSPTARESVAARWPGAPVLDDLADLTPELVDLVVVAVPNHLHASIACGLLERGIPVFLEKPVCLTATEADRLAAAERAGGAPLLAGSAARHRADISALGAAVAREAGEIRHIEAAWVRAKGVPDAGGWFTRGALSGGGALVDLGWHLLDTVGPLLGPDAHYTRVLGSVSADFLGQSRHGTSWRSDDARTEGPAGDVEDTARGFLLTSGGVSVALRASWASHEAYDTTTVRVEGSTAALSLRCTFGFSPNRVGEPRLVLTRDGVSTPVPFPAEPVGTEYDRQLTALPGLLAEPASRGVAVADARRTIGVIERLYAAARETRHPVGALVG